MHVERKANNSIYIIREIKGLANISRTKLLRIYNSLVSSIIELQYGCPVWQITPTENMKKFEAIQRKGLSICLGLPATSGREAMEVEGNILPVDLRIEEIEVREIAKIQSKNIAEPVKQQLEEYLSSDDIYEQQESPFGKAMTQAVDMFKATKVDIKLIEPEVTYKAGVDVMITRAPSYWSRLGSSKNRTAEQTEESKEVVKDLIGDTTDITIVAFTDGSCQGNPRPCGSGAVLYPGDNEGISLKRPVAQRGSILLAELVAILMVLEHCIAALKDGFTDIKILSDSQTAVGILTLNWKSSNYIDTITHIKENIGTLMRYGMRTTLSWIPSHANIAGNEIADQLAKEAAKESVSLNKQYNVITMSDVKQAVKTST
jgi:ribonuclease HI